MFDPKKLLDDLLGSKIPGTESTVREKAGQATQLPRTIRLPRARWSPCFWAPERVAG